MTNRIDAAVTNVVPEVLLSTPFALYEGLLRAALRDAELTPAEEADARAALVAVARAFAAPQAQGSVCIAWKDVAVWDERAEAGFGILRELGLVGTPHSGAPWMIDPQGRLYAARFLDEETRLAKRLAERLEHRRQLASPTKQSEKILRDLCRLFGADEAQSRAVMASASEHLLIVSGGPGTGKTTSVVMMLEGLLSMQPDLRIGLAAPTGKAASRMLQSIGSNVNHSERSASLPRMGAVVRGASAAQMEAKTIHKWLVTPTPLGSRPGPGNPMALDVLVVDEASMIDIHLAVRLLEAIAPETRLILLGDMHQLAAVGPGSVFADLTEANGPLASVTVVLKESRRFARGSIVWALANAVNQFGISGQASVEAVKSLLRASPEDVPLKIREIFGVEPPVSGAYRVAWFEDKPDQVSGLSKSAERWMEEALAPYFAALDDCLDFWVTMRGETRGARGLFLKDALRAEEEKLMRRLWEALEGFRPLAAQREGPSSVEALNRFAADRVLTRLRAKRVLDERFPTTHYAGRPVIVRRNDDVLGVFNGDVGIELPLAVDNPDAPPCFATYFGRSEGMGVRVPSALLPEHDTAFAMTIHQSQGSEFQRVAVFLPAGHDSALATRELLYTGITRTKSEVTVFGSAEVLERSIMEPTRRTSGLGDRLRECLSASADA